MNWLAAILLAQATTTISGLPAASPAPGDVVVGVHGGTLGVGGTTSKFTIQQMAAPISAYIFPSLLASPTTVAQATFPGSVPYTFPAGVSLSGVSLAPADGGLGPYAQATGSPSLIDVFDGDSITVGVGSSSCSATFGTVVSPTGTCWPDVISQYDGAQELNMAVSGTCLEFTSTTGSACNKSSTTSGSLINRYPAVLLKLQAGDNIYLQIGTNDVAMRTTNADAAVTTGAFKTDLITVASAYKAAIGTTGRLTLGEIPYSPVQDPQLVAQFNYVIADVAMQYGYALAATADAYASCALDNPTDTSNCINTLLHPDANGQVTYAARWKAANYRNVVSARGADQKMLTTFSYFFPGQSQGQGNVRLGYLNLTADGAAADNTAIGNQAMPVNVSGNYNTAVGYGSLLNNPGGGSNTSIGGFGQASSNNTSASNNTSVGFEALYGNTTGAGNTAVGELACQAATTPQTVSCFGYNTQLLGASDTNEVVIGASTTGHGSTTTTIANTTYVSGCVVPGTGSTFGNSAVCSGTGAPAFAATNGSIYLRYDGSTGTRFYVNTSGASTTGSTWTAEF